MMNTEGAGLGWMSARGQLSQYKAEICDEFALMKGFPAVI